MAHAWWCPHHSGKRSSASCTLPIKAKTALYAGPDRCSTGHPSQTIFAMWSVAVQRVHNAFPPTPWNPSWSNRRPPARSSVLPPTSSSGRATTFWCMPTASLAGPKSAPVAAQPDPATPAQVISLLKEWMSEKGIPVRLTTDGGPQFTSRAFKEFCASWGICHTISSPHHHETNGATEAAV